MNTRVSALFLLFGMASSSYALFADSRVPDYTIKQISNQPIFNQVPLINLQADVVWGGAAPGGSNLFLYDQQTAKLRTLGNGNLWFGSYQINRFGDVIWMESGASMGLYLYKARTQTTLQLANTSVNPYAGYPQLSDNGDVVWVDINGNIQLYDASKGQFTTLVFPGATLQGYPRINARGDIAWLATVGNHSQILLYRAADETIADISKTDQDSYGNHQINILGDVLWNGSDGHDTEMFLYHGNTKKVTQLTNNDYDDDFFSLNARGDATWVGLRSGTYVITLYRADEGSTREIATATNFTYAKISARADLVWRSVGSSGFSVNYYDGVRRSTSVLVSSPQYSVYDLALSEGGDVVWSLSDGNDYEIYTYQPLNQITTALTNNQTDDGIAAINALGDVTWMNFGASDTQIMLALKRARHMQ